MGRLTDYEILRWLLDGTKESAEADWEVEVTDELLEQWAEFQDAVWEELGDKWSPLSEADVEALEDAVDDSAAIDAYHTITGAGIDVADGRWDPYLAGGNTQAKEVAEWLRQSKKLAKYADDSGAGSLNDALWETVMSQKPRARRTTARRPMPTRKRNPVSVISKYLKGI